MDIYKVTISFRNDVETSGEYFIAASPKLALEMYWEKSAFDEEWPSWIHVEFVAEANQ